jgi:hypothetical protein
MLPDWVVEAAIGLVVAAVSLAVLLASIRPMEFVYQGY